MKNSRSSLFVFGIIAIVLISSVRSQRTYAASIPTPITSFELADLPDGQFDKVGWSQPTDDGGIKCRKAFAGKNGTARIKAWWKNGDLRPTTNDQFILEVKYKDVLAQPAEFHIFSGIAKNFGFWSIHRFGGANDGQWKTAAIPVPWDMVARLVDLLDSSFNSPDMTAFQITSKTDLPITSVTVRKAIPEDEARFYAECRAIIAAEQVAARSNNPVPTVKIAPKMTGPIGAFPWDPIIKLYQNNIGELGKPVKVRMCLNELEPGSFGIYANGTDLTGVDYEVSPLTDSTGKAFKAVVERRTAEYTVIDGKWAPIRLWPAYAVNILKGRSHWFFFNVETKRGETTPGLYKGKITVTAKEGKVELPLEVEVLPIDLLTMDEAGLTMFACYSRIPPMHDIEFARRYNYGGALLWNSSFSPSFKLRNGKITFDFTYPDDWMKGARQRGFTGAIWYLGGDSAKMPKSLKLYYELFCLDKKIPFDQWCAAQDGKNLLPPARKRFVEWMRTLNEHAISNGWLELFPTPHDEPQKWASKGDWIKPFFKDACAAIREADPRILVYGCIHHVKGWKDVADLWKVFVDDIDIYNTNAINEDHDVANKVRKAGAASKARGGRDKLFWQYSGLARGMPEAQRFTFGFFFGAFGSTGFTAWAYNWDDVWDLSGRYGDYGVTAWPTAYQTIPSPWMEGQREGLDDRRIIATYQKRFAKNPEALKILETILDEAAVSRSGNSSTDTEAGFFEAVNDINKLNQWRNTLLNKLTKNKL